MSESQIDWERVAKEIIKTLGIESARGLYYAFMIQGLYPLLQKAISGVVEKTKEGRLSQEDAWREIAMKLTELQSKQPLTPPSKSPGTESELAAQLARELQKLSERRELSRESVVETTTRGGVEASVMLQVEMLKEEIKTLERTRNELLGELYKTLDDEKRKKIEENLEKIERKIKEEYLRLDSIRAGLRY